MVNKHAKRRYVAYYRVSTDRQGRSGLGLEAQRTAVEAYRIQSGGALRAEFTEVQSGKDDGRPQLKEALKLCRLTNSTLLIAKLDRLSRNVAFLATLQQAGTKFVACDLPEANELVVHILAAVAQAERKAISERTKAALAAAKARGVQLGNPNLRPGNSASAINASKARTNRANERADELCEVLENAERQGLVTLRQLASYLNDLGIASSHGKQWHANSVRRIRRRLASLGTRPLQLIANQTR
jgi:DNA invertase Pin-like site-specific DNA recombinase